eukprot:COSAG01_NODE_64773_length_275_cov_0.875000_1_plen_76_part_10
MGPADGAAAPTPTPTCAPQQAAAAQSSLITDCIGAPTLPPLQATAAGPYCYCWGARRGGGRGCFGARRPINIGPLP